MAIAWAPRPQAWGATLTVARPFNVRVSCIYVRREALRSSLYCPGHYVCLCACVTVYVCM
jgi:hypothetical protein